MCDKGNEVTYSSGSVISSESGFAHSRSILSMIETVERSDRSELEKKGKRENEGKLRVSQTQVTCGGTSSRDKLTTITRAATSSVGYHRDEISSGSGSAREIREGKRGRSEVTLPFRPTFLDDHEVKSGKESS